MPILKMIGLLPVTSKYRISFKDIMELKNIIFGWLFNMKCPPKSHVLNSYPQIPAGSIIFRAVEM